MGRAKTPHARAALRMAGGSSLEGTRSEGGDGGGGGTKHGVVPQSV